MPKPLSKKDLRKYHEGMYELDFMLGATNIIYYPLLPSMEDSLYKNTKKANYGDPIYLTGQTRFPSDPSEHTFMDSSKKDIRVSVVISHLAFSRYSYVSGIRKATPPLDPYSIVKGYFVIDSKKYVIDDCVPTGLFANSFTAYTYTCRGVDFI